MLEMRTHVNKSGRHGATYHREIRLLRELLAISVRAIEARPRWVCPVQSEAVAEPHTDGKDHGLDRDICRIGSERGRSA